MVAVMVVAVVALAVVVMVMALVEAMVSCVSRLFPLTPSRSLFVSNATLDRASETSASNSQITKLPQLERQLKPEPKRK